MDDTNVTTEQAISWLEKRLEQRPTPGERVVFSMALSALRAQKENSRMEWINPKQRPPTEDDANAHGFVIAADAHDLMPKLWFWEIVAKYPQEFACWMPLPPIPGEEKINE